MKKCGVDMVYNKYMKSLRRLTPIVVRVLQWMKAMYDLLNYVREL